MITQRELKKLIHLRKEAEYLEAKIRDYKPVEIVIDSVKGSSPSFPYTEHSIKIEGLEQRKDNLTEHIKKLCDFKKQIEEEEQKIELEIQNIEDSEIRLIIRYHYIEGLNYIQIMHKMSYNAPETPRMKLRRYLEEIEQ
jgi:chromosome segregation ATPase